MEFPLSVELGFGARSAGTVVTDAAGREWGRLRGDPGYLRSFWYPRAAETTPLYRLEYDNFGPEIRLGTAAGERLGTLRRTPWRSIWRAHYVVRLGDTPVFVITEENPFIKLLDFFVGAERPLAPLMGLVLNPTYRVARGDGEPVLRIKKERSLHENHFSVHALARPRAEELDFLLLAVLAFIGRESTRG